MGRLTGPKWEKSIQFRPVHNIISSDFPKYQPTPWKFMDGPPFMSLILSYEYQRKWVEERENWRKRMFPENIAVNVDLVKRYVATFKTTFKPPKPEQKKPFKIKKFENIPSKTETKRKPNDKVKKSLKK